MRDTKRTRAEKVEANRTSVLAAARQVFLAKGYAGATLDAIAEQAGCSKGVVYSQFGGKADLFLALLDARIDERAAQNERLAADAGAGAAAGGSDCSAGPRVAGGGAASDGGGAGCEGMSAGGRTGGG